MFRPTLTTAPAELPVTLSDVKAHAVIDHSDDDDLLTGYMVAAVDHLDGFRGVLGRAIVNQTWQVPQAVWCRDFVLPVPDVSAVVITYSDSEGVEQTVATTNYRTFPVARGTRVVFKDSYSLPTLESDHPAPITVQFTCGFGGAADVPGDLKVAIAAYAACWNEYRGEMPAAIAPTINKYRWSRI